MGHHIVFRYRGIMNWSKIYKSGMAFFRERRFEFHETRYKDKTNEFEGDWKAIMKIDAYTMVVFDVYFHAMDMIPTTILEDGKKIPGFNGKLQVDIKGDINYNYKEDSPGGEMKIFKNKDGWLHKVYEKITQRDREEDIEDFVTDMADKYHELLKNICNVEAKR